MRHKWHKIWFLDFAIGTYYRKSERFFLFLCIFFIWITWILSIKHAMGYPQGDWTLRWKMPHGFREPGYDDPSIISKNGVRFEGTLVSADILSQLTPNLSSAIKNFCFTFPHTNVVFHTWWQVTAEFQELEVVRINLLWKGECHE